MYFVRFQFHFIYNVLLIVNLFAEVSCLAFQKVDFGVVNALLPTNQFIPVDWEDCPTNDAPDEPDDNEPVNPLQVQNLHRMIPLGQGLQNYAVSQHWQDFTNIMTAVKEAILARVSNQDLNISKRPPPLSM